MSDYIDIDSGLTEAETAFRDKLAYYLEGVILRRLHQKRIEGYTIETSKELATVAISHLPDAARAILTSG